MRRYNYIESVCLLFNISIEANSVDQDQTGLGEQSALDLHCFLRGFILFQ